MTPTLHHAGLLLLRTCHAGPGGGGVVDTSVDGLLNALQPEKGTPNLLAVATTALVQVGREVATEAAWLRTTGHPIEGALTEAFKMLVTRE